jgi:hypothetical protein
VLGGHGPASPLVPPLTATAAPLQVRRSGGDAGPAPCQGRLGGGQGEAKRSLRSACRLSFPLPPPSLAVAVNGTHAVNFLRPIYFPRGRFPALSPSLDRFPAGAVNFPRLPLRSVVFPRARSISRGVAVILATFPSDLGLGVRSVALGVRPTPYDS